MFIVDQHFNPTGSGNRGRTFDERGHGAVYGDGAASVISAGLALFGGMDDPVRAHGHCLLAGADIRCRRKRYRTGAGHLLLSTGSKFPVAVFLLSFSVVSVFFALAAAFMGAGLCHDPAVLQDLKAGGTPLHSLSVMADICGLSQRRGLVAQ